MSSRTLKIVIGALVGFLGLYGILLLVGSRDAPVTDAEAALSEALAPFDSAAVEALDITGLGEPIALRSTPTGWTVNGFKADTLAVKRVTTALSGVSVGPLVSSNPENHERLGVAGAEALELKITGGGAETSMTVGTQGPGGASTYVRLPESDDVVILRSALRTALDRPGSAQWRDRTVVRLDTAQVARLAVEHDGEWTEIVRADSGWTVDSQTARELPVRDLLGGLEALIGVSFAPDSVSVDPVARRLVALGAEGDTLVKIEMGASASPNANVPVRTPGVQGVVELSSFQADRITPTRDEILGN